MNGVRWAVVVCPLLVLGLAGCGKSPAGTPPPHIWVAPTESGGTTGGTGVPGTVGFLNTGPGGIDYLRWQRASDGTFQGTELQTTTSGDIPDARVAVDRTDFEGRATRTTVTLGIGLHSIQGVLSGSTLTLDIVQQDGSIQPVVYHQATDADYNEALRRFRASVNQVNDQQQTADSQAGAEQRLASDYQQLDDDTSQATTDLSGVGDDLTGTGDDLTNERSDQQNVLAEAHDGTDNGTVCGDAAGVSGDAAGLSGDATGLSGDLQTVSADLATLQSDATALTSDLSALLGIEPGYTGAGEQPTPTAVRTAAAAAAAAARHIVTAANKDIDQENANVSAAYRYAATASKAGACDTSEETPDPIPHITSPFTD